MIKRRRNGVKLQGTINVINNNTLRSFLNSHTSITAKSKDYHKNGRF